MPINIELKKKDPKFKGDRPSYNLVVSGPVELFNKGMERFMFMHGMNALNAEGEFSIWSTPPSIGAPPLYLCALLREKYGFKLKKKTQDIVNSAIAPEQSGDSLDHFIGASRARVGGKAPLSVAAGSAVFVANCSDEHWDRRQFLEGAGWLPVDKPSEALIARFGSRPYQTRDPFIASNLELFMPDAVNVKRKSMLAVAQANIKRSTSQVAPDDFSVSSPEGLEYMDFQKGGIQMVVNGGTGAIIADDMGLGKAQPLDAKVLTPIGWRFMGDLEKGDFVIGSNGKPTEVIGVYPQGEKEIFRVTFSDGSSTECCEEHLWSVRRVDEDSAAGNYKVLSLRSIIDSGTLDSFEIPCLHSVPDGVSPQQIGSQRRFKLIEPVGQKLAQCIAVSARDHLYVTDDYILTHNTIQGIGVLNGRPEAKRIIIFCQANMKLKWCREVEKWKINSDLTVGFAEGKTFPDTDIVVINYDIAQKNIEKIRSIDWDLILTDEAHNLKNLEAQRTQAILGDLESFDGLGPLPMAPNGQLVHLTGTPKPNRVAELWPLLTSSRPDIWGTGPEARQAFLNRYEPPFLIQREVPSKFKNGKPRTIIVPMNGKPIRELELQMRMRGTGSFVRRLKRDTDLPPKMRTPIEMPFRLSQEDQELLKQAEADLDEIHDRIRGRRISAGESRQAREVIDVISGMAPGSPHFSEIARVRKNLGVLKAPHAGRFIIDELHDDKELPDTLRRKTVVFAHHKEVIRKIAEMAEAEFPGGVLVYDGSSKGNAQQAQAKVDAFQENPKSRLFIMSLSGATGITLTAAHRMRVVEPDWSPSNMTQIEDRIWRIGQEQACDIGYLFVPNSLDVKMGLALHAKMETDERAVNTMSFRGMKVTRKAKPENISGSLDETRLLETPPKPRPARKETVDEAQPELPL
ncbi:hypothetical protein KUV57_12065 [Epibacterium sp. DP7N7-1]|nr:hypothetical protein [Epibacterium sp. DP7N7-1]